MSGERHPAGHANYRGDQRHIIGEVKGPLTYGGHVIAVDAEYDPATDRTRVAFAHLTEPDRAAMVSDEFGIVRVPDGAL